MPNYNLPVAPPQFRRRPQLTAAVSKDSAGAVVPVKKTGITWPRQDLKEVTK